MPSEIELKKCPFCGGEASLHKQFHTGYEVGNQPRTICARWVSCDNCGASCGSVFSIEEAAAAWNRRAEP